MKCREITLKRIARPTKGSLNNNILWLASSFGLFTPRDKSSSCFRIFVELLKASKAHKPLSSDELAFKLHLSRGTVVYHLNRLIDEGIAAAQSGRYSLRAASMQNLIRELKADATELIDSMLKTAKDIDESFS